MERHYSWSRTGGEDDRRSRRKNKSKKKGNEPK